MIGNNYPKGVYNLIEISCVFKHALSHLLLSGIFRKLIEYSGSEIFPAQKVKKCSNGLPCQRHIINLQYHLIHCFKFNKDLMEFKNETMKINKQHLTNLENARGNNTLPKIYVGS